MARQTYWSAGRTYNATGKYKTKKQLKKRVFAKKRGNVRAKTAISSGLGFPRRMTMTHRYAHVGTLATGVGGALATINFRANSMYDPDQTFIGHQPMYFDQMTALYDHWTVIGSKITVTFAQLGSGATDRYPAVVGIFLNDDSSNPGATNAILENSFTNRQSFTTNGGNPRSVTCKYSAKKIWGGSILGNPNLQGSATTNPAEETFFTIFADSTAGVGTVNFQYVVQIDYIAVWTELKDIASS